MLLERAGTPLRLTELPTPEPGPDELRLDVAACAVCRTDLHVVDGEVIQPKLPLVIGHQVVGRVSAVGPGVDVFRAGDRVGVGPSERD